MTDQTLSQFRRVQRWCGFAVVAVTFLYAFWFAVLMVRYTLGRVQVPVTDMAFYIAALVILTMAVNAAKSTFR